MIDFDKEREEIAKAYDNKMGKWLKEKEAEKKKEKEKSNIVHQTKTKESSTTKRKELSSGAKETQKKAVQSVLGGIREAFSSPEIPLAPNQTEITLSNGKKTVVQKGASVPQQVDWNKVKESNFGNVYTGASTGLVNAFASTPSVVASKLAGKNIDISDKLGLNLKNDVAFQNSRIQDTTPFKLGELGGEILGYGIQSGIANPLTSKLGNLMAKTEMGKAIATNAVDAATVGALQNVGIGYQQGLRGKELAADVFGNTLLDMGVGTGLSLVGAGARKMADLPQKNVKAPVQEQMLAKENKPPMKTVKKAEDELPRTARLTDVIAQEKVKKTSVADEKKLKSMGADTNKNKPVYKESKSIANSKLKKKYEYETTTHAKRREAAKQRVETDYKGEYEDLTTKQKYTDEDYATARKVYDSEKSQGRHKKASRLMRKIAEQSSQSGQELEAVKHIKDNTASGKVYKGHQQAVRAEKVIAEKNPKQFNKAKADIKEFVDLINKSANSAKNKDEFVNNVKTAIDKLLEPKTKNKKEQVAIRKEIFDMVDKLKEFDRDNVDDLIDEVSDIVKTRYGIPVLTSNQAKQITDLMEQAEKATGREKQRLIAKADQIIADLEESTFNDKMRSLQRISLLSNPKTLLSRNMGGTALLGAAESIKDIPATMADIVVSKFTGERTTTIGGGGKHKETLKGLGKGVADQLDDIKYGVDTSASRGQYELPNKTIWDVKKSKTKAGKILTGTMNFMDKAIGKSLQMGDRPFYEAAYRSRKAELENLVSKGKAHLTAQEIDESAKLFALDRTFQSNSELARWAKNIKKVVPFGDLIVPFTQTPANIIDKLLDYSPTGMVRALKELGNVKTGTFDQKKFVDTIGRTFTGTGAIILGYSLYKQGLMTTDIYQEGGKDENNARTLAGQQSYALKLGDTYVSVDWADPIGSLLMIGADFGRGLGEKEELYEVLLGGVTTAVDGIFDRSFLSGLTDLFDNISNDGVAEGLLETFISQVGSQVTPNVVKSANRVIDPVKRETYDDNIVKKQLNVIQSGIPGLSQKLPAKRDITGEKVLQYQGRETKDRALESLLLPYNKTTEQHHKTNDYLLKLYEKTGDAGVLLDQAPKNFTFDSVQYKIGNAENLAKFQEIQGKTAVKKIEELRKSKAFNKLSQAEQITKIKAALSDAKLEAEKEYLRRVEKMSETDIEFALMHSERKKKYNADKISKNKYVKYYTELKKADETNSNADKRNGSYDQDEARKALDKVGGLTEAEKRYLWSCTNKNWNY